MTGKLSQVQVFLGKVKVKSVANDVKQQRRNKTETINDIDTLAKYGQQI